MPVLNRLSTQTLQEQLYNELLGKIKSGEFKPGEIITSELKLSEQYDVSRVTVRRSIQQLVDEGYLIKRKGKGTFVKPQIYVEKGIFRNSFTSNCQYNHSNPLTHIIECREVPCSKQISEILDVDDDKIIKMTRVRKVDDVPCIIEVDYLPQSFRFLLDMDMENRSLLDVIADHTDFTLHKYMDKFSICNATKFHAQYLNCPLRTPLLLVKQEVQSEDQKIIYYNEQYILTSKYIYVRYS